MFPSDSVPGTAIPRLYAKYLKKIAHGSFAGQSHPLSRLQNSVCSTPIFLNTSILISLEYLGDGLDLISMTWTESHISPSASSQPGIDVSTICMVTLTSRKNINRLKPNTQYPPSNTTTPKRAPSPLLPS